MRLARALRLARKEVVTLVGGGGKTTTIFRLARELERDGKRVVVTTTTRMFPPAADQAARVVLEPEVETLLMKVAEELRGCRSVVAAAGVEGAKLVGIAAEAVARLIALPEVDTVIVEADGSQGRSLKAPGPHEPPVPSCTTLLIPVAGMDVVGQSLSGEAVHRPEQVTRLTGLGPGQLITPEVVATVLADRQGGLKHAPPGARIIPLLNKVEGEARLLAAREAAQYLLALRTVEAVLLGSAASPNPIREVHHGVGRGLYGR